MQKYHDVVLNSNGQPVASAAVLVRPTGTTNTATIYGDIAGTGTRSNPLTADSAGRFWFYGTNGRYDLVVSGSYIQTTTVADVMLEDVPLTNLQELSTASQGRASLGLGSIATYSTGSFFQVGNNLSEGVAATVRSNIGLAIGTNVQAFSTAFALTTGSQTIAGGKTFAVTTLASTGQITPDLAASGNFELSMTVNTTLATPSNAAKGQEFRIAVFQNSTAKTLAYNSAFYKFVAGATATLSTATAVGTVDIIRGYVMTSTSAECEIRNGVA